tara:strand:- start:160 stop:600 length:441 start_codon:yes stop_codon:yes gene_type:complete
MVEVHAQDVIPSGRYYVFHQILKCCWSSETSADPEKYVGSPSSYGQCAVSALLFQEIFGGELMRSVVNGVSHYWNRDENGDEVDFTRSQFQVPVMFEEEVVVRDREYVLSNLSTMSRYNLLKSRYLDIIRGNELSRGTGVEASNDR